MPRKTFVDQNEEGVLIASAAYTTQQSCSVQANTECGGVEFLLNVTGNPGGGETLTIHLLWKDPVSGTNYIIDRSQAWPAGNGALRWTPRVPLPRSWLASVNPSAAGSWTYSLSASRVQQAGVGLAELPAGQRRQYSNQSSSTQTDTEIWAAVSGLKHYVTSLYVAVNGAVTVTLEEGTSTFKWRFYGVSAGDNQRLNFSPPLELIDNTALTYTTSGAIEHCIVVTGITGP